MHTIGVDLVEVEAFERAINQTQELYPRLFSPSELKEHKRAGMENLSAWFAAKEAVMKAIWGRVEVIIEWHDIMIFHGPQGQPIVKFSETLMARLGEVHIANICISLSHVTKAAAAVALIEFE